MQRVEAVGPLDVDVNKVSGQPDDASAQPGPGKVGQKVPGAKVITGCAGVADLLPGSDGHSHGEGDASRAPVRYAGDMGGQSSDDGREHETDECVELLVTAFLVFTNFHCVNACVSTKNCGRFI